MEKFKTYYEESDSYTFLGNFTIEEIISEGGELVREYHLSKRCISILYKSFNEIWFTIHADIDNIFEKELINFLKERSCECKVEERHLKTLFVKIARKDPIYAFPRVTRNP